MTNLQGILMDLDGVLFVGDSAIEGAVEAVARVKSSRLRCRFITNTSTVSRDILVSKLQGLGFEIAASEIFSAPRAAASLLRGIPNAACFLLVAEDVRSEFQGLREVELEKADYIVLGDIGDSWSHELLNRIFNRLMNGTRLIAIHKNRYWQTSAGLTLDIGGLVTALEYCSGVGATVVGKPSADFFRLALGDMGLPAARVAVVGDDVDSDVGGGQMAGLFGILVRTGKFRRAQVEASRVEPDMIIDSVRHLLPLFGLEN
ncbi:TIGR01458 family HAD-type hydrolase [Methyloterricola oryzae]|uniref:TIGR01458 family HAD-type hydrolase n=1 Tax=Methyloterricola oryzae TaxID=1495050 RepID=UPI001F389CAF|nr:TIGR01458 family HAD-type hydrolase [Methyloterricola oryzae]